jgi:DNA-binding GntR family transcriptional regulator
MRTTKGVTVATIDESTINDIAVVRVALESLAAKTIAADKKGAARARLRAAWEPTMRPLGAVTRHSRIRHTWSCTKRSGSSRET